MNLKSAVIFEVIKEERLYRFEIPVGAPYGECYDAGFAFLKKVEELSAEAVKKAERAKNDENSEEKNVLENDAIVAE